MDTVRITFDSKKTAKWLTIIMIVSLFILPFIGWRGTNDYGTKFTKYVDGESLAWILLQGKLFVLKGAAWLWILCMLSAPVAMHFTKEIHNKTGWTIKITAAALAFLGSLLLIAAWTETKVPVNETDVDVEIASEGASMMGTWIYMIASAALCGTLAYEGRDYFIKK